MQYENWLIDFDDTVVVGPLTWAVETALPDFIQRHGLPNDPDTLKKALIHAQEVAASQANEALLLQTFLADMDWSPDLQGELFKIMRTEFRFAIFDDTIPYLERLNDAGCRVMIVSNDNRAPFIAIELEIEHLFQRFFTPNLCFSCEPKPSRSMFDHARTLVPSLQLDNTIVVGDDPWSEGAFAANCDLPCIILDRRDWYGDKLTGEKITRVRSLAEIDAR